MIDRVAPIALVATLLAASVAVAEPRLVTNIEMCAFDDPIDTQEMGMELDATSMSEIEYYCEFSDAVDLHWDEDRTVTRAGYCSEPGFILPTVFALQMNPYEPGIVRVWQQGGEEPVEFRQCP